MPSARLFIRAIERATKEGTVTESMTDETPILSPFAHKVEEIISAYERDETSYDLANQRIIDASEIYDGGIALYWAGLDLWCAKALKEEG